MRSEDCRGCCYCDQNNCTKMGKRLSAMMALRYECYGKHRCGYKKQTVLIEESINSTNPADFIDYSTEDNYSDSA